MNKIVESHFQGLKVDWKAYNMTKKDVLERVERLLHVAYAIGVRDGHSKVQLVEDSKDSVVG